MTPNEKNPDSICFNGKQYLLRYVLEEGILLPKPDFEEGDSAALVGNELWVLEASLVVPNLPIHPNQEPNYIKKWVLVGHIEPILVGKMKPVPRYPRYIKRVGTQEWIENPLCQQDPAPSKVVGEIVETTQGHEILTINGWVTVPDTYLGVWPTEEELPEDDAIKVDTGMFWRGELYTKDDSGWRVRMGSKTPIGEEAFNNSDKPSVFNLDALNILGSWALNTPLPDPAALKPGDSLFWCGNIWVVDNNKQWARTTQEMPEGGLLPFSLQDFEAYQATARDNDFEHQLDLAMDDDWNDKGSMARVLLETRKENKRLKRNRFIAGVLWRLLFLGILVGAGYGAYQYIFASIQTGRYVDERSCKVSKGGLTITGKRTFSYPYKSLFGYRLLDETQVIVKTIVDIKGDRLTVTGFNGQKYWQSRVNMGEKGILILKDADTYMFQTDKDLIVATSGGFCNPVQRELSEAELKQPELDIIK